MAQKFKKLTENRTQKFETGFKFVGKFLGLGENEYIGKHLVFETEKEVVNIPFYSKIEQHEAEIKKGKFYLFDNIRMEKTKEGQQFLNFDIFELSENEYEDFVKVGDAAEKALESTESHSDQNIDQMNDDTPKPETDTEK